MAKNDKHIDFTPKTGEVIIINEVYVFVADDEKGGEGIMAATLNNGMMMPLIASDLDRFKSCLEMAERLCKQYGKTYKILKFDNRKDVTKDYKP